jgi:hypothetical protein
MKKSLKEHFTVIKDSRNIKNISVAVYYNNIKKLSKELWGTSRFYPCFLKDTKNVIAYIDNLPAETSKKTMLTSIIVILKSLGLNHDHYSIKLKEIAVSQNNMYIKNEKSKKEQDNWVSYSEIQDKIDKFEDEIMKIDTGDSQLTDRQQLDMYQKHLVISLYTLLPPLRNDYSGTRVFVEIPETEIKENYIILKDKQFILKNYKTVKHYGVKIIDLPKKLISIIRKYEWFKSKFKPNHDYLLINTTDLQPMSRNNLTKCLNKIFYPKNVSSTVLRKVYLSNKYPVSHTYEEALMDSSIMGHDINTARKIYSKKL